MSVNPGSAARLSSRAASLRSARCATLLDRTGSRAPIEVDGGIDTANAGRLVAAGADDPGRRQRLFGTADPRAGHRGICARRRGRPPVRSEHGADVVLDSAFATPRPTRWGSSTTRTISSGSRSARADLLRTLGWSYREMEHSGVSLPVIEAHCEYHRAGALR